MTIFLTVLGTSIMAQVNQTDTEGRKQGIWEKKFEDSHQLRYRGQFQNDIPVGTFTYWHLNGAKRTVIEYRGTNGVGYAKLYDIDGWRMAEGLFRNQEKDSTWNYYGPDGDLVSTEIWVNGKLHGKQITYYSDGSVAEITNYEYGHKEGKWVRKYADGSMRARGQYVNNKLHGDVMYFDQQGRPEWSGTYVRGLKEGSWYTYKDGKPVHQEVYFEGNLIEEKDL